jgi:hypothetical protein
MKSTIAFVAFAALSVVLAVSAPSHAEGVRGHGFEGSHGGGAMEHHGFEGHHFEGRHFEGHGFDGHHFEGHDFDRRHFGGHGFWLGPVFPYYPPVYTPNPGYWYYCQSYGAYYPTVTTCPDPWETVPAE